jgi:hypothetical protein
MNKTPPWEYVKLPKIVDARGNLSFIESCRHVPFAVRRVYFLYDVPEGASRAAHAHYKLNQLFIAISGSFDLLLDDGFSKSSITLNRASTGLLVRRLVWRDIINFSSNAVCLVLASEYYDEADYIRSYEDFQSAIISQ